MTIDRNDVHASVDMLLDWRNELDTLAEAYPEHAAQLDARIYQGALTLLSRVAGPSIGRVLERERDGAALGFLSPNPPEPTRDPWKNPRAVNAALARLLYDMAPALGSFPARGVAGDLHSALSGDSPTWLAEPKRRRGQRDHRQRRAQARLRLVLAVYYEAGRKGRTVAGARGDLFPEQIGDDAPGDFFSGQISDDVWKDMAKAVPGVRRNAVYAAGKEKEATPDAANAAHDIEHNLAMLAKLALS